MGRLRSVSFALPLCVALGSGVALAADDNSGGLAIRALVAGAAADNHGHFVCTAAINAGGVPVSGEYVNAVETTKLFTGTYQVGFNAPCPNVQIANGWFRIVQPDTLELGRCRRGVALSRIALVSPPRSGCNASIVPAP